MRYHAPITRKNPRKSADKTQKSRTLHVNEEWLEDDFAAPHATGPRLSTPQLHALSRKGLWGLLLFLLASVAAFLVQDFNLYLVLPEPLLQLLGCPPPAILIHLALTAYSFTVVVPVLIRMATGDRPMVGWHHLACRSVFYLFYLASTTLPDNFLAVMVIGILLYGVEQAGIWSYMSKNLSDAEAAS